MCQPPTALTYWLWDKSRLRKKFIWNCTCIIRIWMYDAAPAIPTITWRGTCHQYQTFTPHRKKKLAKGHSRVSMWNRPLNQIKFRIDHSLNMNQSNFHWLNQWCDFLLNHRLKKYFSLLNQLIFTEVISEKIFLLLNQLIFTELISEIWLLHSNLFLAIWISQISLIISRFWLIQI